MERTSLANVNSGPHHGRRLTHAEFYEIRHDWETEVIARTSGSPIPPPTAKRRAVPVQPLTLNSRAVPPRIYHAANDNKRSAPVVPTTESTPDRVANALSPALRRTLFRLRELARPIDVAVPEMVLAAASTIAKDDTGIGIDHRHVITPGNDSLEDLIAAFADGMRTRIVVDRKGCVEKFIGGIRYHRSIRGSGEIVEIGGHSSRGKFFGLRAHRGQIIAYGKQE